MRFAVIGCGLIGEKRALAARSHKIVAVCDVDDRKSERLARLVDATSFSKWADVIALNVDAVIVATTHHNLAPITLAALNAGKHVLVEKPAGLDLAQVETIAQVASDRQLVVKVGFNHRFHPAFVRARQIVDSGALGPLMFVRARYGHGGRPGMEREWRCKPELSGGGELIDQGSHLIDLSRWFLGDLVPAYAAAPTLFWDIPVDDNCFLALETTGGQVAWLHASWTEWKNTFSFELFGRDGKLAIDGLGGSYGVERLTFYRMLPGMGPPETTSWEFPFPDTSWGLELTDFVESIETQRRPCGDIADAVANMAIIDAIYRKTKR